MHTSVHSRRRASHRTIMVVVLVLVAFLVAALCIAGHYFYDYALKPGEATTQLPATQNDAVPESQPNTALTWLKSTGANVFLTSEDDLQLRAQRVKQGNDTHRWVILCHGYRSSGDSMAEQASMFFQRGFSVLVPDARGHGESEGDAIGMGWLERRDIVGWASSIAAADPDAEIILYGVSMGGTTVMMASGEADLPRHVKLIIEDCGYTSVLDEFREQLNQQFGLPPFPLLYVTSGISKLKAGYFFGEASAVEQLKKCQLPILFIHGEEDTFVPYSMLDELYAAAAGPKEKLSVPGATHGAASKEDPEVYWTTIDRFIAQHLI